MLHTVAALLLSAHVSTVPSVPADHYRLLHVAPSELDGRPELLAQLGFDHVGRDAATGAIELPANDDQVAQLDLASVHYTVAIDDLEEFYASRLGPSPEAPPQFGAWLSPSFGAGSMGGYYPYSEIMSVLDQIHATYPALTTAKASIGTTLEGRSIWMIKVSDNPGVDENEPEVRIDAMHHAREPEGMQSELWFMLFLLERYNTDPLAKYLVDNREFFFIPCVNPDGYVYNQTTNPGGGGMWRKNRRDNGGGIFGVDLNRNYNDHWGVDNTGSSPSTGSETYRGPTPASELENQAMQAFIGSRNFQVAISLHTYSNLWLYPYGYAQIYPTNNAQYVEVSNLATEINHYQVGPPSFILYLANGVTCDYDHDIKGSLAWTPEIGSSADGFWPPTNRIIPLADENLLALQRSSLVAGAWARQLSKTVVEVGDGDGFYEPGEHVDFTSTVRNTGRNASSTGITVTLSSASPYATITNGVQSLGALAGFTQTTTGTMALAIAANTPAGTSIPYSITLAYEGWSQVDSGTIPVGAPVPFLIDDAETDWGWSKGVAGDTATGGIWTRGAPIATNSGGQPSNPGADNTSAPGTQCFVTGNAGGAAGTDDVDNGFTTLLSPVFDLSNCGPATLSFARWFADLSVADDTFVTSISNNGGQSWTTLESVFGNNNAWNVVNFNVPNYVAQTANMRLRFVATDAPNNSLVEAAIDDLKITILATAPRLNLYGKPVHGTAVQMNLTGPPGASFALRASIHSPNASGSIPPSSTFNTRTLLTGTIPASQLASVAVTLPSQTYWIGRTLWLRGVVTSGNSKQVSNWAAVVVQ